VEAQDITLNGEPLRLVIYGAEGVGKTTLAMSFPRPLVIDTDDGLISVTYAAGGQVPGTRMAPEGYRNVEEIVRFVRAHAADYDTIVIDDVSTLCDDLLDELTAEHAKAEAHKKRPLLMENIPEQIEYQGNQQQLRRLLKALRQTKKHVVVIGGLRIEDKTEKHVIDASPKAQRIIGKWCHVIGELQSDTFDELGKGIHRVLFTEPSRAMQAKSRFPELRPNVVDPTFDTLWDPIKDRLPEPEMESNDGITE
jgi:hypothetical protein